MTLTRNGWNTDPPTQQISAGGHTTRVIAGAPGNILELFARRFHDEVEPIATLHGYRTAAYNKKVGGIGNSNHVSATAIDINGARHYYEASATIGRRFAGYNSGFSAAQVRAVRNILADFNGVISWGEDFNRGYRDGMHFEIIGTAVQVGNALAYVNSVPSVDAVPTPVLLEKGFLMALSENDQDVMRDLVHQTNSAVGRLEALYGTPDGRNRVSDTDKNRDLVREIHSGVAGIPMLISNLDGLNDAELLAIGNAVADEVNRRGAR